MQDEIEIPRYINESLPQVPEFEEQQSEESVDSLLDEESVEDWINWFRFKEDDYA